MHIADACVAGALPELPCPLGDGELHFEGALVALIPLPFDGQSSVQLDLESVGRKIRITGSGLRRATFKIACQLPIGLPASSYLRPRTSPALQHAARPRHALRSDVPRITPGLPARNRVRRGESEGSGGVRVRPSLIIPRVEHRNAETGEILNIPCHDD